VYRKYVIRVERQASSSALHKEPGSRVPRRLRRAPPDTPCLTDRRPAFKVIVIDEHGLFREACPLNDLLVRNQWELLGLSPFSHSTPDRGGSLNGLSHFERARGAFPLARASGTHCPLTLIGYARLVSTFEGSNSFSPSVPPFGPIMLRHDPERVWDLLLSVLFLRERGKYCRNYGLGECLLLTTCSYGAFLFVRNTRFYS